MKISPIIPLVAVLALTACSNKYYPEMYTLVEQEANVVVQEPKDSTLLTPPIESDQAIPGFAKDSLAMADTVALAPVDTVKAEVPAVPAVVDSVAAVPADTVKAAPAPAPEKIRETQDTYTSEGVAVKDAYHVVVGSFRSQVNAQNLSISLKAKGFMSRVAVNQDGLYRVFAYSTDNEPDVRKALALIRESYPDAWMLKIAQ